MATSFRRGAARIGKNPFAGVGNSITRPWLDVPSAGSHEYTIQCKVMNAGQQISLGVNASLTLVDFAAT